MPDVEELVIEGDNGSPDVCGIEFRPCPFSLGGVLRLSEETIIGELLGGGGGGLLARVDGCGVLLCDTEHFRSLSKLPWLSFDSEWELEDDGEGDALHIVVRFRCFVL